MSKSSVEVTTATRLLLKAKKTELGLRSVDAVIQHLCANLRDAAEDSPSSGSDAEDGGKPEKRRKVDVREPLYSLEVLAERRKDAGVLHGFRPPRCGSVDSTHRGGANELPCLSFCVDAQPPSRFRAAF